MTDNNTEHFYDLYLPNLIPTRKKLFKEFYKIEFINDLPVTNKNRINTGFHPLIASYVLRHILWEILNCPRGSLLPKIDTININNDMYEKTKHIFLNVYK